MALTELKQSTIQEDANLVLRALAAETADAVTTAIDCGPFTNGKISVVCSAGFVTGTLCILVQQSSDVGGSGDAFTLQANQIAESFALAGAAANAGAIIWEAPLHATKRYVRISFVNETPSGAVSKTFAAYLTLYNGGK